MITLALLIGLLLPSAPQEQTAMTTYQMVLLRKGANPMAPMPNVDAARQEHLARMADSNRKRVNLLYGPVLDEGDLAGIAVLAVASPDEAKKAFADDPFVKAGVMVADVRPWFGPKDGFQLPASYDVTKPDTLEPLVLGFLADGPNRAQDQQTAAEIQKGHLAYMSGLHEQGKLLVAGPFMDEKSPRGIVIYRVGSMDEAKALAAGDPAVKAGRLVIEAHPWMTLKGILK